METLADAGIVAPHRALVTATGDRLGVHAGKPSGARSVGASEFAVIAEHRQIDAINRFLDALPRTLGQES